MSNSPFASGRSTPARPQAANPTSPTQSTFSETSGINLQPATSTPRSVFRGTASTFATPSSSVRIRADPSIATCFDPSDKELYALWAPRA
ncbi:hypothetical protein GGG16DRAFT_110237 [Schizophyllum commune]